MSFEINTIDLTSGSRLGICPLPGRGGARLLDLEKIAKWGPDIMVSMTELVEMDRHNMEDLGGLLQQFGIGWEHFPICDFGPPKESANWAELSIKLHKCLDQQGSVLLHCYGGQGRSGMILLRLLVERGGDANVALRRLREIRPGAVETDQQFEWAGEG